LRKAPTMLFDRDQPLFLRWAHFPRLVPWLARYLSHCTAAETRRIAAAVHGIVSDSLDEHLALAAGTGAEHWVVPSDYVFLYPDRQAYLADHFAWEIRRAAGLRWDELDTTALRAVEPDFGPSIGFGARLGGHGRISDPGAYVRRLADHAKSQGARLLIAEVEDIARAQGRVTGVRVRGEILDCDAVVVATGAWSGPLAARLGLRIPLESERGYHLELWEPSHMPRNPVMVAAGKFVATPMEGRLRLAGIVEFGGLNAGPSEAPIRLLERQIQRAMPNLTWRETRRWMGHRPSTSDSVPLIGPVPGLKGAWLGFGHQHIGLTAGPRTARMLAAMIAGRTPNQDVAAYAPARFG
ncbi:MAG: FAD-binding oxidoreductase, partial [Pseudomonadota bacterium]